MNLEHRIILCKVSDLAKNPDIYKAVVTICSEWSDGNSDCLLGAYDYLAKRKPNDLEEFINMLSNMVRVNN